MITTQIINEAEHLNAAKQRKIFWENYYQKIEAKRKIRAAKNKYEYLHVLQGNYGYGHGWEDLTCDESRRLVVADKKAYELNEGGNYRIIRRRELKEEI